MGFSLGIRPGTRFVLVARLTDNFGNPVPGKTIYFYRSSDGASYEGIGSARTGTGGEAKLTIDAPPRTTWFKAVFPGDNEYEPSSDVVRYTPSYVPAAAQPRERRYTGIYGPIDYDRIRFFVEEAVQGAGFYSFNVIGGGDLGVVMGDRYSVVAAGDRLVVTIMPGGYVLVAPAFFTKCFAGKTVQYVYALSTDAPVEMEEYMVYYDPGSAEPSNWEPLGVSHRALVGGLVLSSITGPGTAAPQYLGLRISNGTSGNVSLVLYYSMYRVSGGDDVLVATSFLGSSVDASSGQVTVLDRSIGPFLFGKRYVAGALRLYYRGASGLTLETWINDKLVRRDTVDGDGSIEVPFILDNASRYRVRGSIADAMHVFRVVASSGTGVVDWAELVFYNRLDEAPEIWWYREATVTATSSSEQEYTLADFSPFRAEEVEIDYELSSAGSAYFYVSSLGQEPWEQSSSEPVPLGQYSRRISVSNGSASGTISIRSGLARWVKIRIAGDGSNQATLRATVRARVRLAI